MQIKSPHMIPQHKEKK